MREFLPVVGWPEYEISTNGEVRRVTASTGTRVGRLLKPWETKNHYMMVVLSRPPSIRRYVTVHRLIAEAFLGPIPDGIDVCHNNGVRNDNRLENLRLDTRSGNMKDALLHGTLNRGERCGSNKYTEEFVRYVRDRLDAGEHISVVSSELGIPKPTLYGIRSRQTWGWL